MIKVLRHGNTIAVRNPINGQEQTMVNITFIEPGRGGADLHMSETSAFLTSLVGEEVGLANARVHTHPVRVDLARFFPVDKEFPGFINRGLYSTPQLRLQQNVDARMLDGRPTYFKTWIGNKQEDDVDMRISTEALIAIHPDELRNALVGVAEVRVLETPKAALETVLG